MGKWDWVKGFRTTRQEETKGVISASYALSDLIQAGLVGKRRADQFGRCRLQTGCNR